MTEIMFNPSGNENQNEFIEVFNTGSEPIDLTGWTISDGENADRIVPAASGTLLLPGQYGVILDPDYFGNSAIYDEFIPAAALILTIDGPTFGLRGLSNSSPETVALISGTADTVSAHEYSVDNPDGISEEKILIASAITGSDWGNSIVRNGTPGARNSISPLPNDIQLIHFSIEPRTVILGQDVIICSVIRNSGERQPAETNIRIFNDIDGDNEADSNELLWEYHFDGSDIGDYGDTLIVKAEWAPPYDGFFSLIAITEALNDENLLNNRASAELIALPAEIPVVVSEIMYYPLEYLPEWIELFNNGNREIDLRYWSLTDEAHNEEGLITQKHVIIPPADYIILTGDSSAFRAYYPVPCILVQMNEFPRLNNQGDIIRLIDPADRVIEETSYDDSWGFAQGVSIERIDLNSDGSGRNNWALSTADEGATPGKANSLQPSDARLGTVISADPNPFIPETAPGGRCTFSIIIPFNLSHVTMKIFDRHGRLIRDIVRGEPRGTAFTETWDGRNNNGAAMPTDIYIVYLSALSSQAGTSVTKKTTVVLARE
ncbi:lamin tail domain-containing protein [candidate division KSB1 bacterium]